MQNKLKKLKEEYENVCNSYIKHFSKKQGYEFDYWIGDEVGGIASFIEMYYFHLSDIIYDLENKCAKGMIFQWQEYNTELPFENINYKNYLKLVNK
jgi:hypothetical protein